MFSTFTVLARIVSQTATLIQIARNGPGFSLISVLAGLQSDYFMSIVGLAQVVSMQEITTKLGVYSVE